MALQSSSDTGRFYLDTEAGCGERGTFTINPGEAVALLAFPRERRYDDGGNGPSIAGCRSARSPSGGSGCARCGWVIRGHHHPWKFSVVPTGGRPDRRMTLGCPHWIQPLHPTGHGRPRWWRAAGGPGAGGRSRSPRTCGCAPATSGTGHAHRQDPSYPGVAPDWQAPCPRASRVKRNKPQATRRRRYTRSIRRR